MGFATSDVANQLDLVSDDNHHETLVQATVDVEEIVEHPFSWQVGADRLLVRENDDVCTVVMAIVDDRPVYVIDQSQVIAVDSHS